MPIQLSPSPVNIADHVALRQGLGILQASPVDLLPTFTPVVDMTHGAQARQTYSSCLLESGHRTKMDFAHRVSELT